MAERAFILGFDGMPWPLVRRWTDAGELPNFERIRSQGAAGPLDSTRPATTPVAWPSIATGSWPDGHEIYEFMQLGADHSKEPYTRNDIATPALWEYLEPAVVGNVPMTFPPPSIDGKLVSGMMTPSADAQFTHPPELSDRLLEAVPDYRIELDWSEYSGREDRFLEELGSLLEARRASLELLMEDAGWRLFFFVFTAPDRLQHLLWDESTILDHYRMLDRILGDVLDYCDARGANLFVVSDHGFGPVSRTVSPNTVLSEAGYLTERADGGVQQALSSAGLSRDRVVDWLERAGVDISSVVRQLPTGLVDFTARQFPGDHALYDVSLGETDAIFTRPGSVYINDTERFEQGVVSPERVPDLRRELLALFRDVTDPETGECPFDVYDGSELFAKDPASPDLILAPRDGYTVKAAIEDRPFGTPKEMTADHRNEGIVLAYGPDIDAGVAIEGATVVDVAPTLLHSIGEPVPSSMDGDVLERLFAAGTPPATTAVRTGTTVDGAAAAETAEDFSDVEDRLRGLGYMD